MNFGDIIKNEILSKNIREVDCQKAFIAGIVRGTGSLFYKGEELGLIFRVSGEQTAMVVSNYFTSAFNYDLREVSVSPSNLNKKDVYEFTLLDETLYDILEELGVIVNTEKGYEVSFDLFALYKESEPLMRAFIKGLFISSGSCTVPSENSKHTGYHLEISFSHPEPASQVNLFFNSISLNGKVILRKGNYVLYLKSADEIKDFIAYLPAPVSVLKITDIIINREMINNVNRKKNCDISNVSKQVEASMIQVNAINKIIKEKGLDYFKEDLRQVATFRLKYQEDTLTELAEKLGITKSCLNHRLRKIVEIYKNL